MKYLDYVLVAFIALATVGAVALYILNQSSSRTQSTACTMDAMLCPDGSAVGRTGPDCAFAPCLQTEMTHTPSDVQATIDAKRDRIVLNTPTPGARVTSPIMLEGLARGMWYFEASFPVVVTDWDGLIIGEGIATAQSEWMTENFVPFTATVTFTLQADTPYRRGTIILKRDNPSGLPEHDDALEIPVTF